MSEVGVMNVMCLRIGCSAFLLRAMFLLNVFLSSVHTAFGMISGF